MGVRVDYALFINTLISVALSITHKYISPMSLLPGVLHFFQRKETAAKHYKQFTSPGKNEGCIEGSL